MLRDAWRLSVGTLTALPVPPPEQVDRRRAGAAMLLAPLAALPLAAVAALVGLTGVLLGLPPLVVALLVVGAVAMGNRGFHLDGLSDVADGLAASFDRERSLAVMKTGTSGPAGGVALLLVLGLQASGLAALWSQAEASGHLLAAAVLTGLLVSASRAALPLGCLRGLTAARPDGLGRTYTETVPPAAAAAVWLVLATLVALAAMWAGLPWWRGLIAVTVAALVVAVLLLRALRRFGGLTGDVLGAGVELALAALLVVLS